LQQPIPVILITAYADGDLCSRAAALGATAVFGKPFDMDDLRTALLNVPQSTSPTQLPSGAYLQ
jgi:two-component system response regulator (stage 0 sporulation protein F)